MYMLKDNRLEFVRILIESYKNQEAPSNYRLAIEFLEELDTELTNYRFKEKEKQILNSYGKLVGIDIIEKELNKIELLYKYFDFWAYKNTINGQSKLGGDIITRECKDEDLKILKEFEVED